MTDPAFEDLLRKLSSSDNDSRQNAEKYYSELKKDPQALIQKMIGILSNSQADDLRSFSAVLLRRVLIRENLFEKLSPEAKVVSLINIFSFKNNVLQASVKHVLLSRIKDEQTKDTNKRICDVVSDLGAVLADSEWPELLPCLFQLVSSTEDNLQISAFHIFSEISGSIMDKLKQHMSTLSDVLVAALQSQKTEVIVAAFKATVSIIQDSEDDSLRNKWRPLIPPMLNSLANLLNVNAEREAQDCIELIVDLGDAYPRFWKKNLSEVVLAMIQIAEMQTLDAATRQLAAEFVLSLNEAREKAPNIMKKLPDMNNRLFHCFIGFLLDIEDDPDWYKADTDAHETDGEGELFEFGQECLDRLSMALGGSIMASIVFNLLPQLIQSQDWKQRHAALICMAQVAEGSSKIFMKDIKSLVDIGDKGLHDSHPKVRWAGCQAIGQMCTDLEPKIQELEHARVIPSLLALMDDFNYPRIQAHAAAALVNFTEGAEEGILPEYLNALVSRLLALLKNGQKIVQEGALTAIASLSDCTQKHFLNYYDQVMPLLKAVLVHCNDKNSHLMRAKALECVTLVGMSVGKDRFREDAKYTLQFMQNLQEQELEPDDPIAGYMLQAGARLCKCLGSEFIPYLGVVMPQLMHLVKEDAGVSFAGDDGSDSEDIEDDDEDVETIVVGGKKVSLRTSALEEKATACGMLCCYADELKEGFLPYINEVSQAIIPLLTFLFSEEVRRAAVLCIPELFEASKAATEKSMQPKDICKQHFECFWGHLCDALGKEPELDVISDIFEALQMMIDAAHPEYVSIDHLLPVFLKLNTVLVAHNTKRFERLELLQADEYDEEDYDELEDEIEADFLERFANLITSVLREFKDHAMHLVDGLMPEIGKLLDANRTVEERRAGINVIDDILEHSQTGSQKYMAQVLPVLLDCSKQMDSNLRQCAVYGLGVLAQHHSEAFVQVSVDALQILVAIITAPDSRSPENNVATENAVSALGKVIEFCSNRLDQGQVVAMSQTWLDAQPITEDEIEAHVVHKQLVKHVEANDPRILGEQNKNLVKVAQIFCVVLSKEHTLIDEEYGAKAEVLLKHILTNLQPNVVQGLISQLKPQEVGFLQKIMSN